MEIVRVIGEIYQPGREEVITARLLEIDALSDSPRARREALLGDTAWLSMLNAEAATLRAELKTLPQ